jgi:hypothetical protein
MDGVVDAIPSAISNYLASTGQPILVLPDLAYIIKVIVLYFFRLIEGKSIFL